MAPRCFCSCYCTCRSVEHFCNCASHHDIAQHPLILDQSTSPQEVPYQWSTCMSTYSRSHCVSSASDTSADLRLCSSRGNSIAPDIVPNITRAPALRGQSHSGNSPAQLSQSCAQTCQRRKLDATTKKSASSPLTQLISRYS